MLDIHGVGDLAQARRRRLAVLMLALLGVRLAHHLLGALRRERHALRNDHGVDLHTEAASHVVRRTDWHAIGQLGVLTAWLKPALLHWRDTAPVWMLHRCGGEPGGWQTRATGRRAPKRRYGVAASRRASLMATGEYII